MATPVEGKLWRLRAILVIAVGLALVVLGTPLKPRSLLAARILGLAADYGFLYQTPGSHAPAGLIHFGRSNGLVAVSAAVVLGAFAAMISGTVAAALSNQPLVVSRRSVLVRFAIAREIARVPLVARGALPDQLIVSPG